jgi:hypothetical protein
MQQKNQRKLLRLSARPSRTIGWRPAQVVHPVIGSSIADARITSPAMDQCSSLHRISSKYETGDGIRWGHIVCIQIWESYVDLAAASRKDGNDHTPRSGAIAGVVQPHLPVLDHRQQCQNRTSEALRSQPLHSPWRVDCHSISGRWATCSGSGSGSSIWDRLNTPRLTTTAACWHLRRRRIHSSTMQRSGCFGTAAWHTWASRLWRSCPRSLLTLQ